MADDLTKYMTELCNKLNYLVKSGTWPDKLEKRG